MNSGNRQWSYNVLVLAVFCFVFSLYCFRIIDGSHLEDGSGDQQWPAGSFVKSGNEESAEKDDCEFY